MDKVDVYTFKKSGKWYDEFKGFRIPDEHKPFDEQFNRWIRDYFGKEFVIVLIDKYDDNKHFWSRIINS